MNRVIIMGRLGQDPKVIESTVPMTAFSIATNEMVKKEKTTVWHNVIAFNKTADLCTQYLKKGRQVIVEGRISYRKYKDKDGIEKTQAQIIANNVTFLAGESGSNTEKPVDSNAKLGNEEFYPKKITPDTGQISFDDIPF